MNKTRLLNVSKAHLKRKLFCFNILLTNIFGSVFLLQTLFLFSVFYTLWCAATFCVIAYLPWIHQGQVQLDLFVQRTNPSQPERACVFSHAQEVGAHTLTLTDHSAAWFCRSQHRSTCFFFLKKRLYRKKNALLGLIFNSRENKEGISLLPSTAFSHLLTESCSRMETLYPYSCSALKTTVEMKGVQTNSWI